MIADALCVAAAVVRLTATKNVWFSGRRPIQNHSLEETGFKIAKRCWWAATTHAVAAKNTRVMFLFMAVDARALCPG